MSQKTLVLAIILLSMGISGAFGFSFMEHGSVHTCPISVMLGGDCPPTSSIALVTHHISGLQTLTQAVQNSNGVLHVLSLFFLSIFALAFHKLSQPEVPGQRSFAYKRQGDSVFFNFQKQQRWLALRNKRDPYALCWAYDAT